MSDIQKASIVLNWVCRNVSKEILLADTKFQAKVPSHSGNCVLGGDSCTPFLLRTNDKETLCLAWT